MSNDEGIEGDDNWIFDSLVNFLHGNIWRMPVMGFIEEKSVVFDPDSFHNLSEEREAEYRKIHEEYKALVDFMLSSFMEDLQVTPEQVEEACQLREKQPSIPDSHVTKVALEQLQAAEDFTVFRRIMTRKNIDLQLQSLELLVAKYGVLSPALRSEGADSGETGEDDFLQVVIRYCGGDSAVLDYDYSKHEPSTFTTHKLHKELQQIEKLGREEEASKPLGKKDKRSCTTEKSLSSQVYCSDTHASGPSSEAIENFPAEQKKTQIERDTKTPEKSTLEQLSPKQQTSYDSQLVQQDLEETPKHGDQGKRDLGLDAIQSVGPEGFSQVVAKPLIHPEPKTIEKGKKESRKKSVTFDKTTAAEIATVAPEQHRMLSSVRKALEVDPTENVDIDPEAMKFDTDGSEEEIEKRRAYLRAQRDKLVTLKKRERELKLKDAADHPSRPKSARAAQSAMTTPPTGTGDKSLAARRALAARLKRELLEK